MKILKTRKEAEEWRASLPADCRVSFVPTMGALHEGHLSLFSFAKKENDIVIGSIFVNPTQFNNLEDLEKYPRTEEKDLDILRSSGLADAVFLPGTQDLYPQGTTAQEYDFDGLDQVMEGAFRPGHFQGVATVVEEFFRIVQPTSAYFGEKDYQQLRIIEKTVQKKGLPVQIRPVPIMREKSGLAMSSRNERLSAGARSASALIYQALKYAAQHFRTMEVPKLRAEIEKMFMNQENVRLEYFTIAEAESLQPTEFTFKDRKYRAFIAVYYEDVRLIDNMEMP